MEVKNKLVIFDIVLFFACFKNRSIGEVIKNMIFIIIIFEIKVKAVGIILYSLVNKIEVVSMVGLVINGILIGMVLIELESIIFLRFLLVIKSDNDSIRSSIFLVIIKLEMLILISLSIQGLPSRKAILIIEVVIRD